MGPHDGEPKEVRAIQPLSKSVTTVELLIFTFQL